MKEDLSQMVYIHGWQAVYDALMEMRLTEEPLLPLPENPAERPCWGCRRWIKVGEQAAAYHDGRTYHLECRTEAP